MFGVSPRKALESASEQASARPNEIFIHPRRRRRRWRLPSSTWERETWAKPSRPSPAVSLRPGGLSFWRKSKQGICDGGVGGGGFTHHFFPLAFPLVIQPPPPPREPPSFFFFSSVLFFFHLLFARDVARWGALVCRSRGSQQLLAPCGPDNMTAAAAEADKSAHNVDFSPCQPVPDRVGWFPPLPARPSDRRH